TFSRARSVRCSTAGPITTFGCRSRMYCRSQRSASRLAAATSVVPCARCKQPACPCTRMQRWPAGVPLVHVPYRGGASAVTDLLSGQVQVVFGTITASSEHIRAGKLRALAVTTATRSDVLPEVPTVAEFVPGYEASNWNGICVPKNTSAEIIDRVNQAINTGLAEPKIEARLADLGGMVLAGSPSDFGKIIADETEKWAKVIKFAGATVY